MKQKVDENAYNEYLKECKRDRINPLAFELWQHIHDLQNDTKRSDK